jgi:hypothetical protein
MLVLDGEKLVLGLNILLGNLSHALLRKPGFKTISMNHHKSPEIKTI